MSTATQSIPTGPVPALEYDFIHAPSPKQVWDEFEPPKPEIAEISEQELWSDEQSRHLLIGHRVCRQCKLRIEIGPTLTKTDLVKLLHSTCTSCSAIQCRGCSTPKPLCSPRCNERTCTADIIECCSGSRAIAIFETLSEFDKEFSSGAARLSQTGIWPVPRTEREHFLHHIASRGDARLSNKFNKHLGATLQTINQCLENETTVPVVKPLLTSSFLFEAIYAYLRHDRYINWAINAQDVYIPIMHLLQILGNHRSFSDLLTKPLPSICLSSGVQVLVWYHDEPTTVWFSDVDHPESLIAAVFSNNAQQGISDLEKVLEKHGSAGPTSNIRMAFYKLFLLNIMGPALP